MVNHTLYSDVLYTNTGDVVEFKDGNGEGGEGPVRLELPTMLGNCSVVVEIVRGGEEEGDRERRIRVNGVEVEFVDSVTRFGVMHTVDKVLIPGRPWDGDEDELTVEELMDRLRPWVEKKEDYEPEDDTWTIEHLEL